jgi:hypothetical protein
MRRLFTRSFLVAVALLVATETAVRIFYARGLSGRFDYGYHPTAGFRENSDGSLDLIRAGGRRFHPQPYSQRRPAGTFRVMVVGDSVPRGPSLEDAYAARLATVLRQRGVNAESWNLAVPGYGAHRCHVVLQKALDYQPSVVVRHVNNSNEFEDEREWRRSQDFKGWHVKNLPMKSVLIRRLYEMKTEGVFWALLPEPIRAQQGVNDAAAEIAAATDEARIRVWQERVKNYLAADIAACRKAGVPILLITQVRLRATSPRPKLDDNGLDALANSFASADVAVLSMKESLSPMDFAPLFMDNAHLHPAGHQVIAELIATKLAPFIPQRQ